MNNGNQKGIKINIFMMYINLYCIGGVGSVMVIIRGNGPCDQVQDLTLQPHILFLNARLSVLASTDQCLLLPTSGLVPLH